MKTQWLTQLRCHQGFTLVELMVSALISSIIIGALYMSYVSQQRVYVAQDQVAETQQTLRSLVLSLLDEMRLAGCDPTGKAHAGISLANARSFSFSADVSGNSVNPNAADGDICDANEQVAFAFAPGDDANNNGIADGGGLDWSVAGTFSRQTTDCMFNVSGWQPVAEQIEAMEFNYLLADGSTTTAPAMPGNIRAVQVSILARASRQDPDPGYTDPAAYTTASGRVWVPGDTDGDGVRDQVDHFRRRFATVTVQLRNMGM